MARIQSSGGFDHAQHSRGRPLSDAAVVADQPTSSQNAQKVERSESEWRSLLTPEQYHVLREKGTERPFTGALVNNHSDGLYHCAACNAPLFKSDTKFESGSGWPSFFDPISPDAVKLHEDRSYGMRRVEATCATCGSHLGHVFPDGTQPDRSALLHQFSVAGLFTGS